MDPGQRSCANESVPQLSLAVDCNVCKRKDNPEPEIGYEHLTLAHRVTAVWYNLRALNPNPHTQQLTRNIYLAASISRLPSFPQTE